VLGNVCVSRARGDEQEPSHIRRDGEVRVQAVGRKGNRRRLFIDIVIAVDRLDICIRSHPIGCRL